jgi:hypothetical protein
MKRWFLIYLLLFLFLLFNVSAVVLACSGCAGCPWMDIENDLGENTIVVRGSGNSYSDRLSVHVSEYLVGEPDYPYLRVYYAGEGQGNASLMGYYIGSCGSGAKFSTEEAYYVMTHQQDGTYRINHIIGFSEPNSDLPSAPDQFVDTSVDWETYSLTEEEFLERINANPQPPLYLDSESAYGPVMYPRLILTENDSLYLVPVDARSADDIVLIAENVQSFQTIDRFIGITTDEKLILHESLSGFNWEWDYPEGVDCAMIDCITFSDNGIVMTRQVDADTIQICELALIYPNSHYVSEATAEQHPCIRDSKPVAFYDGTGVSLSTDSGYMAIWHNDEITIYGGMSWLANLMWEDDHVTIASTTIEIPTNTSDKLITGHGIWSKDSRWLAYSDAQGLWLWDVFTQEPQLFLPTDHSGIIPTARFFSESGRYIGVSVGEEHFIIDRFSNLTFPDGVIRPDDRMMIRRDTVNELPVPAETCNLLNGDCTALVNSNNIQILTMTHAYWSADSWRQNVWYPCYIAVEPQSSPQYSGYCNTLLQIDENGNIHGDYNIPITAIDVLDSPIKSLTWFQ